MTLTANTVQYPDPEQQLWSAPPDDPQHIFRLTIADGQAAWCGDEDVDPALQLPDGSVWIDAPLAEGGIPSITITPGLTSGESNISGGVYKFLDDKGELDAWLFGKAANGLQMFGGTLEHFIIERGEVLANSADLNRALWYTWIVRKEISLDDRVYSLRCEDINRNLEREVFAGRSHTLMQTVQSSSDDVIIALTDEEAQNLSKATWAWQHGSDYHVHPGETRAIGRLSDSNGEEFISWTGVEDINQSEVLPDGVTVAKYRLTDVARGLFGTIPRQWAVDTDQGLSGRRQLEAVPYAEEHPLSMVLAVYCSYTLDLRKFPWGLDVPTRWVDTVSLAQAAQATEKLRITVRSPEKDKAKSFVEEHCLARRGILVPSSRGKLFYVPAPIGSGTPTVEINDDNCYGVDRSALKHDDSDTAVSTIIKWDLNPSTGEYRKTTEFREPLALGEISGTESETVEAPYITTNRSTEAEVLAQGRVLHARHARPVKRLTVKPDWALAHYAPGMTVQVNFPDLIDYTADGVAVQGLYGPMMIGSVRRDHMNESLSWALIGFRPLPSALTSTPSSRPPDEEYIQGGTLIEADGSGVASLTQPIDLSKKYYYLGDLTLPDGWPHSWVNRGDLELWVKGTLLWAADVDLSGRGGLRGTGGTGNGTRGQLGAQPAPKPSGSVSVTVTRSENSSGEPQGVVNRRITSRLPSDLSSSITIPVAASVTVERGRLVGVPTRLMGSGGSGADGSTYRGWTIDGDSVPGDSATLTGGNGADGGAGVKLVCDAGSGFVGNGALRINGDDAPVNNVEEHNVYAAVGAGGARGQVAVFHTSQGTPWSFDATRLEARNGKSVLLHDKAPSRIYDKRGAGAVSSLRSYYDPAIDTSNRWAEAFTIRFLPPSDIASDAVYGNVLDEFFANQRDGSVSIIVGSVDPSDGNLGDLLITQANLDSNDPEPPCRIFTPSGWRDYDWETDTYTYIYAALIYRKRTYNSNETVISETRPIGKPAGTVWYQPSTRTEWLLGATPGEDQLLAERQVPQGENMIDDISFVRSGAGERLWVMTRDAALTPVNVRRKTGSVSVPDISDDTPHSVIGITLDSTGRTVAGHAYQDNGGGVIVDGRQGTVTLHDGTVQTFTVGGGDGSFSTTFPSTADHNLGKSATVYTSNAGAGTQAQRPFVYEVAGAVVTPPAPSTAPTFGPITLFENRLTVNWTANNPSRKFAAHLSSSPQPSDDATIGNDLGQSHSIGSVEQHVFTLSRYGTYTGYLRLRYSDNDWTDGDTTVADGRYIDTTVSITVSSGGRAGVAITNEGATAAGNTIRIYFTDSEAIDGVTRYDVWEGDNDLTDSIVAPATYIDVPLPADGQQHTLTLRPPAGYTDDEFEWVSATFTAATSTGYPKDGLTQANITTGKTYGQYTASDWTTMMGIPNQYISSGHNSLDYVATEIRDGVPAQIHQLAPTSDRSTKVMSAWTLSPQQQYTLVQTVHLESDYAAGVIEQGAKLGYGLSGGSHPSGGGGAPNDGFSCRIMVRGDKNGNNDTESTIYPVLYLYSHDQNGTYGEDVRFIDPATSQRWNATRGTPFEVTMKVTMNSRGNNDGRIEGWIDGVKMIDEAREWWGSSGTIAVSEIMQASFHGGSNNDWSPSQTNYVGFSGIYWG